MARPVDGRKRVAMESHTRGRRDVALLDSRGAWVMRCICGGFLRCVTFDDVVCEQVGFGGTRFTHWRGER